MTPDHNDPIQDLIDDIFTSPAPYEKQMEALLAVEPFIDMAYALNITCVKPVCRMTIDDLWPL